MAMKIKPAGAPATTMRTTQGAKPSEVTLPEPRVVKVEDARPSLILQGASGSGKTYFMARMLAAGYMGLILAVEDKVQQVAQYNPPVVFLGDPMPDGSPPTLEHKYKRLMALPEALASGKYRTHNGKPIDFIGTDGFFEVGNLIFRYNKKYKPFAASTGRQDSYALWDRVVENASDLFVACRDAAGMAAAAYGHPPVGFVATCGEHIERSNLGEVHYEPLFPGRKGPEIIPYMFEHYIRLACRNVEGEYKFIAHTIGTEEFVAKCPPRLFPAEIENPDGGEVYKSLVDHYSHRSVKEGVSE